MLGLLYSPQRGIFPLLLGVSLASLATLVSAAPQPKLLYVQVKQSSLRAQPKFWAPVLADLPYGTPLTPVSTSPDDKSWLKVKVGETEGYAHVSAVTSRKVAMTGAVKSVNPKVDSLASSLAGKGFNKNVEGAYASAKGVDFTSVDFVESQKIDSAEFYSFIQEGKLSEK